MGRRICQYGIEHSRCRCACPDTTVVCDTPELHVAPEPRTPPDCAAAVNIAGQHFWCDWPTDENGRHDGWGHANKQAQTVWSSPVPTTIPRPEPR